MSLFLGSLLFSKLFIGTCPVMHLAGKCVMFLTFEVLFAICLVCFINVSLMFQGSLDLCFYTFLCKSAWLLLSFMSCDVFKGISPRFRSCNRSAISDRWKFSMFISESLHTWDTVYYYSVRSLELFSIIQGFVVLKLLSCYIET